MSDEKIEQLLAKVAAQRAELSQAETASKRPWETTGAYSLNGVVVNIAVAPLEKVRAVLADLLMRRQAMTAAAEILGIPDSPLMDFGFEYAQWEADLKKRVAVLQLTEKRKKLDAMEARLNDLVSPEKRREMELAALEAALAS